MSNRWFSGRVLTAALLFGLILIQPMTSPAVQALSPSAKANPGKWVGAWDVEVMGEHQATKIIPGLMVFTSDGTIIAARPPHPFESPTFGTWVSTGPKSAAYTFKAVVGSETGELTAKIKVYGTLQYDAGTDSWTAVHWDDITDATGHSVFTDTGTFKATRVAIEAPPK